MRSICESEMREGLQEILLIAVIGVWLRIAQLLVVGSNRSCRRSLALFLALV